MHQEKFCNKIRSIQLAHVNSNHVGRSLSTILIKKKVPINEIKQIH
jgi:hypothetical protein